jgi:hypothetical protein
LQLDGIESQPKHPAHADDPGRGLPEGQRERVDLAAVAEDAELNLAVLRLAVKDAGGEG